MAKISKTDLIKQISTSHDTTISAVTASVDALLDAIGQAVANGDDVQLHGFGKFQKKERAARRGINPRTKEPIQIAASSSVSFRPAQALKDRMA